MKSRLRDRETGAVWRPHWDDPTTDVLAEAYINAPEDCPASGHTEVKKFYLKLVKESDVK